MLWALWGVQLDTHKLFDFVFGGNALVVFWGVSAAYFVLLFVGSYMWSLYGSACLAVILTSACWCVPEILGQAQALGQGNIEHMIILGLFVGLIMTIAAIAFLCGIVYFLLRIIRPRRKKS
jgi:hypothetical protein